MCLMFQMAGEPWWTWHAQCLIWLDENASCCLTWTAAVDSSSQTPDQKIVRVLALG